MKIKLIRHATLVLTVKQKKILIDPMLDPKNTLEAIEHVPITDKNPLVDLPLKAESFLNCDGVLITHTHRDHFSGLTPEQLPNGVPLFCQPEDEVRLKESGFPTVIPITDSLEWEGITLSRTKGRHGYGAIATKMAPVSGFIISSHSEPVVYLTGDTVWCSYIKKALLKYQPQIVIGYCGEAKFSYGRPITLNAQGVLSICNQAQNSKVVAVHMEAWNHCRLTRKELREFTRKHHIENRIYIPEDGETLEFFN
jgi:L-ascorbate metabolism protein UlaG (beta-lactamase superfamily)